MASEPARARLIWNIPFLVLPVTFGHATACRGPALAFSAAIHFVMKSSAPCSAVLRHSPSSWAAVVHWLGSKDLFVFSSWHTHIFLWVLSAPRNDCDPRTILSKLYNNARSLVRQMNITSLSRKLSITYYLPVYFNLIQTVRATYQLGTLLSITQNSILIWDRNGSPMLSIVAKGHLFYLFIFVPLSVSACMESASYVLSFRMVFFYLVTTGWIFDISLLCENSINRSISIPDYL